MELAPHPSLQRLVDKLMLLHPILAAERRRYDPGGVMVAISGQIADLHLGIRQSFTDQPLDFLSRHCHGCLATLGAIFRKQHV